MCHPPLRSILLLQFTASVRPTRARFDTGRQKGSRLQEVSRASEEQVLVGLLGHLNTTATDENIATGSPRLDHVGFVFGLLVPLPAVHGQSGDGEGGQDDD